MSHDVMISFSSRNIDMVEKITDSLEKSGVKCWVSYRDVKHGASYMESITKAIRDAKVVIFVMCRHFNESKETEREMALASQYKKDMMPVRVEDFELSDSLTYLLANVQYTNAFPDFDGAIRRMVVRLREILAVPTDEKPESRVITAAVPTMESQKITVPTPAWSGYWYVNVGEGPHRKWEDNVRFGFIGAGQTPAMRLAMTRLSAGDNIYAYLKGAGYVGYGQVTAPAVMIKDFRLADGTPVLDAGMKAPLAYENKNDPDKCEWAARVNWIKAVTPDQAVNYAGIFANPNAVCKLRNEATLQHLKSTLGG